MSTYAEVLRNGLIDIVPRKHSIRDSEDDTLNNHTIKKQKKQKLESSESFSEGEFKKHATKPHQQNIGETNDKHNQ